MAEIRVGLVGTGYAANRRAEAFVADARSHLLAVVGHQHERTQAFCQVHGGVPADSYHTLTQRPDIDLIVISTVNRDHGAIAHAALKAGKHVVVEYPLALDLAEAETLVDLATQHRRLLHVEHIELLSGIHQALVDALPQIGLPLYVRSIHLRAEQPAPQKWSYDPKQVGFPLIGALSRIQRLVSLFGPVVTVSCQSRFWLTDGTRAETPAIASPFRSCLCSAQLRFASGLIADVVYGKGEAIGKTERTLDIHGETGMIHLERDRGWLYQDGHSHELAVGSRRGLFAQDTRMVLDALIDGTPLYVTPNQSVYALNVADAARRSALTGEVVRLM